MDQNGLPSRYKQERSKELETIRHALIEGEESGEPRPFNITTFKKRLAAPRSL